jgi:predicted kinase
MKAVCFRGPAGVGKTTLAYAVGRELVKEFSEDKWGYVSADMFAHISFDCTYTDEEIDFKYELIYRSVTLLAERGYSLVVDDTFHRYQDYLAMEKFLLSCGYEVILFSLVAPLEVAMDRNQTRFWKEQISDARVQFLHSVHRKVTREGEIVIDTLNAVEDNRDLILQEIRKRKGENLR